MLHKLIFYLGFSTLLAHELDAVARAEWRVLPVTSFLPENVGYVVFVILHIPLLTALMWMLCEMSRQLRERTRFWVAGFLVLHAGLHQLFVSHEHYDFHSNLSVGLILGAGILGLVYLLMCLPSSHKTAQ